MTQYTMTYTEEEEGGYCGQCLQLPGAITQGETLEELEANMRDAINIIQASIKEEAAQKHAMIIEA